jgi:NAD(P)-dependent dehydrogenase (short-subunit alcohol dehydrogenase family)
MDLSDKIALVTGAAAGIGSAIARRLASDGASVVLVDLDKAGGSTAGAIEEAGGEATFVQADVTDDSQIVAAIEAAADRFGGLDILVNNAGGVEPPFYPDAEPARWNRTLDLNLRAPMTAISLAVPAMRRRGGGSIVNIASVGGVGFQPYGSPEYGAAKAGLMRLTASLATLASENIRVTCICPGSVDTPAMARTLARMSPADREHALNNPMLKPAQIADAVASLIADDALAGRIMIWHEGQEPFLVPLDAPY